MGFAASAKRTVGDEADVSHAGGESSEGKGGLSSLDFAAATPRSGFIFLNWQYP